MVWRGQDQYDHTDSIRRDVRLGRGPATQGRAHAVRGAHIRVLRERELTARTSEYRRTSPSCKKARTDAITSKQGLCVSQVSYCRSVSPESRANEYTRQVHGGWKIRSACHSRTSTFPATSHNVSPTQPFYAYSRTDKRTPRSSPFHTHTHCTQTRPSSK